MAISTEDFVKQIETMSVLDLSNLVKALEDRFGVSRRRGCRAGCGAGPAAAAAPAEAQTEFTVVLQRVGDKKINVIKAVREVTSPRSEGSEGPRRGRSVHHQGSGFEGRGRQHQEEVRRGRRQGHDQVVTFLRFTRTRLIRTGRNVPSGNCFLLDTVNAHAFTPRNRRGGERPFPHGSTSCASVIRVACEWPRL